MRYDVALRIMTDGGADLPVFFATWPNSNTRDYTELGLPVQGLAIRLKGLGVIVKRGVKLHYGKNTTRRTLWGQGCNYGRLKDYYLNTWVKTHPPSAIGMQCSQEMPVPASL